MKVSHTEEEGTDGVVARCFSINQQPGGGGRLDVFSSRR